MQIDLEDGHKLIKDYSHGMKNKLQMLCFMIAKPPVILLDEPLTSLDVVVALEFKKILKSIKKDHIILFSTHILQLAADLCDEIVVLNDGVLEELLAIMQDYGVILPNEFVTMARGVSMIEAIAQNLDPEIDVFASIKPIAKQVAKQRLSPKKYLKSKKSNLILYEHMIRDLPKLLTKITHKIENEELQFKFEVDITDKVSIIALVSSLIIGSSVVSFGPTLFDIPVISLIGYILAIILSVIGIKKFVLN